MNTTALPATTIALAVLLLGLVAFDRPSAAAEPPDQPIKVRVAIVPIDIGKLDTGSGSYTVDFYMSFRCDEPCDPTRFELINGKITSIDTQDNKPMYKEFRVQATLTTTLDMRLYPFDRYDLTIVLEDKIQGMTRLVYVPDLAHTYTDLQVIHGWELEPGFKVAVREHYYKIFDETFSQYTFSVAIQRPILAGVLKGLTPAVIMTLIALVAGSMGADKFRERLGVITSSLLGTIVFHLNMTSSLPPIAYMTFADRFMVVNYACIFMAYLSTVRLMHLLDRRDNRAAERNRAVSMLSIPAIWITAQIAGFWFL